MKIFQLIQKPQLRGAEIFASQLGNHLMEQGHECKLIAVFDGDARLPFLGDILELNRPLKKRLWDIKGWKQLAELIKHEKPDVLQANAGDTLKFAVMSKKLFGWQTPIVFRNANKMSDFIDSKLKFYFNRYFLNEVDQVISVSNNCRLDLIDFFSFPVSKVTTVEIGINTQEIGLIPKDITSVFQRGPVFLNVASMVPEKNHLGLLQIFSKLASQINNAQLILIGKGKLEENIRRFANELKIADRVHFLGYRQDVLEIMQACEAFLLPSKIEGLPGVVLEAMYARCPVVAYEVGGLAEVITDGVTGRLVHKNDEETFIRAVVELHQSKQQRSHMIATAHDQVVTKFDNHEIANRFLEVYEKVIRFQTMVPS